MVKSKKKKRQAPSDFVKEKRKVGKKVVRANLTNADVHTRTINVSVKTYDADADTTHRGVTFQDLLSKLGHYNASMRKDACLGLKNFFELHPQYLDRASILLPFFEKISARIADEDGGVRQGLLMLFRKCLPLISQTKVAPFFPLLLSHTCSALTKINARVRLDALEIVDLWLQFYPELLGLHGKKLLDYLLLIIAGERKADVNKGAAASSATRSLRIAPSSQFGSGKARGRILTCILSMMELFYKSEVVPIFHREEKEMIWSPDGMQRLIVYPSKLRVRQLDASRSNPEEFKSFFTKDLLPILLECWIEFSPGTITTLDPDSNKLASMTVLLDIMTLCINRFESDEDRDDIQQILAPQCRQQLFVYFPIAKEAIKIPAVARLNLALATVGVQLLRAEDAQQDSYNASWAEKLSDFLHGFLSVAKNEANSAKPLLRGESMQQTLRVCSVLVKMQPSYSASILQSLTALFKAVHDRSQEKKLLLQFLTEQTIALKSKHQPTSLDVLLEWALTLPRLLWSLKLTSLDNSEAILSVLLALCSRSKRAASQDFVASIAKHFRFFFHTTSKTGKSVFGPFIGLPMGLQEQAVALLFYLPQLSSAMQESLIHCCSVQTIAQSIRGRIMEVISLHAGVIELEKTSFYLSMCLGYSINDLQEFAASDAVGEMDLFPAFSSLSSETKFLPPVVKGTGGKWNFLTPAKTGSYWAERLACFEDMMRYASNIPYHGSILAIHSNNVREILCAPTPLDVAVSLAFIFCTDSGPEDMLRPMVDTLVRLMVHLVCQDVEQEVFARALNVTKNFLANEIQRTKILLEYFTTSIAGTSSELTAKAVAKVALVVLDTTAHPDVYTEWQAFSSACEERFGHSSTEAAVLSAKMQLLF